MATFKNVTINDTGHLTLPIGNTSQRPASPSAGMIRFNSESNKPEVYANAAWSQLNAVPPPPPGFSISPSVGGVSDWDLDTNGSLNLGTNGTWTIIPSATFSANVKMWGAGGGGVYNQPGGGGGSAVGTVTFTENVTYQLIVGDGGKGGAGNRDGAGGGGGTGILIVSSNTAVLVAGGGGGSVGYEPGTAGAAKAGGGTEGQAAGYTSPCGTAWTGNPGTQSGPGAGGSGSRRTGASGSGRNGGGGATGSVQYAGGVGFGNGGVGAYNAGDQGSGGGGGGYFGGGEGGGHCGGMAGGGGSGHANSTHVTNATLYTGVDNTPGNSSDADRGSSGAGGTVNGQPGRIYIA